MATTAWSGMSVDVEKLQGEEREKLKAAVQRQLARRRYIEFVKYVKPDYHVSRSHAYVAEQLQWFEAEVQAKRSPRLMVFLPPRWGKSELTSRNFPPWVLGRHPDWNVGIVSYGAELAEELSADARRVLMADEYQSAFGRLYAPESDSSVELDRGSRSVAHWRIAGRRGGVRAVGVGGALTGRGFDVCIIDDPIKGRKEADSELARDDLWRWYQGTLRTRLEPGGGLLLIQTRWHHDDLAGRLTAQDDSGLWRVLALPALAEEDDPLGRAEGEPLDPERFGLDALEALRSGPDSISSRDWIAQYQQKPTPDEGALFRREWFRIEPVPEAAGFMPIIQTWDTAFSEKREADYSVCCTWRVERTTYRLLHVLRKRLTYPMLKEAMYQLAAAFSPYRIIVEDIGSGKSLVQDLRNETTLPVVTFRPDRDKVSRAHAVTGVVEAGRVSLAANGAWLEDYLRELTQFPAGDHDDMVDATTMFLSTVAIYNAPVITRKRLFDFEFRMA